MPESHEHDHDHHHPHDAELPADWFGSPVPILSVSDFAASLAYYVDVLGFTVEWTFGDPPDFGCVRRGDAGLYLCQGAQGQPGTWVWIGVPDARLIYDEYRASGATIVQKPTNYPWALEMRVSDLDGHVLRIGSDPEDPPEADSHD
jgi:catechol 2,3-dioxygenase-like lactoylglutathione lyase family enzyme